MLNLSAMKAPPALGLPFDLPCIRLQISVRKAGLLISSLEAAAVAALAAGDARLRLQLRDRAAHIHETVAAKAERIIAGLSAKRTPGGGRTRA